MHVDVGTRIGMRTGIGLATVLLIVALSGQLFGAAQAESIFAREGIGTWLEGYDLRGEALGGTGIGVIDAHNFSGPNPASTAFSEKAMGYVGLGSTVRWTTDGDETDRQPATFLTGFGGHVALPSGFGFRFLIGPATDASYTLVETVPTGWSGDQDRRYEEGSRGLLRYAAAATWRSGDTFALGFGGGLVAGSIIDRTVFEFGDSARADGWLPGENERRLRFHPSSYAHVGFLARPLSRLTVGGFLATGHELRVSGRYESFAGTETDRDTTYLDLPFGFGMGLGLRLAARLRLSGDIVWRQWGDVQLDGQALPQPGVGPYEDTARWGIGLERLPSTDPRAPYLSTLAWRIGFARTPWYLVDADGDRIEEWRASFGVGLPVQTDRGMLDLLFVYGQRGEEGETGVEERFVRVGFASTFSSVERGY